MLCMNRERQEGGLQTLTQQALTQIQQAHLDHCSDQVQSKQQDERKAHHSAPRGSLFPGRTRSWGRGMADSRFV